MGEGLRVGTYSSPHLSRYNERFRLDDDDIGDADLARLLTMAAAAEETLGERLMPFEVLTGAALAWFAEQQVDVAVIEVGVLGRFDATNICAAEVAVVTNIGFDHTNGVGDWQLRIAEEKAGIVTPGARLLLGTIEARLQATFAAELPSEMWRLGEEIRLIADGPEPTGRRLSVATPLQELPDLVLPLHGGHQSRNAALAIGAASSFLGRALDESAVRRGLAAVRMPARLETVRTAPTVILDGAHNPDAAVALGRALADDLPTTGRRTWIVGLLAGRDPAAMFAALRITADDRLITCTPPTARAQQAKDLAVAAEEVGLRAEAIDDIGEALAAALATSAADDQIVVTGSIYLVADARISLQATLSESLTPDMDA